ncbi:MAG: T9SS type A sorting domain-containing protein [Bacteroidales bacterium]
MKNKFKRTPVIILALLFFCSIGHSQSVKRQSIGSYGAGGMIDGFFVSQTIGQPFFTSGHSDHVITISPGFQQPVTYMAKKSKAIDMHSVLDVFPNPASDHFFIETSEPIESAEIRITDLNGSVISQEILPNLQQYMISSSHLQNGLYFITVKSENNLQNYISKIVISK